MFQLLRHGPEGPVTTGRPEAGVLFLPHHSAGVNGGGKRTRFLKAKRWLTGLAARVLRAAAKPLSTEPPACKNLLSFPGLHGQMKGKGRGNRC
jgi:hypothetical protein